MDDLINSTIINESAGSGNNGKNNKRFVSFLVFLFGMIIGILVVNLFSPPKNEKHTLRAPDAIAQDSGTDAFLSKSMPDYEKAVISATHKAMPAVVSIQVTGTQLVVRRFRDPFFDRIYGGQSQKQRISSMGSGVIIDPKGIIITNDHVINRGENAKISIKVILPDGRVFDAKLLKNFPGQDIAILSVEGDDLPYLELGNSADLTPGQTVLAIGNPFGDKLTGGLLGGEPTVTSGIISALKRNLTINDNNLTRYYRNMLQTDASINEGNSGGALVDLDGKLIGVNTAIFQEGAGSIGIGFAIPADRIRLILESFRKKGDIGRVYTGLSGDDVTKEIAESLDFKGFGGTIVQSIEKNSPGEKAGFKRGDIISKVNGFTITNTEELNSMFYGSVPGEVFVMTVFRKGDYYELEIVLGSK